MFWPANRRNNLTLLSSLLGLVARYGGGAVPEAGPVEHVGVVEHSLFQGDDDELE